MNQPAAPKRRRVRSSTVNLSTPQQISRGHLKFGWTSLACFCLLGIFLEALHGFKIEWYLSETMAARRGCWLAAHASGTCLSLLHIVFAVTVVYLADWRPKSRLVTSYSLSSATVLIPAGFLLAGCFLRDAKPGMGMGLVLAAVLLLLSVLLATATNTMKQRATTS